MNTNHPLNRSAGVDDAPALAPHAAPASGSWVEIDVTEMAQAWIDNPNQNYGLLLRQASAAGYTVYSFCSERGVWPCTPAQSPLLTVWYH